jgi:hypothetical protein
MEEGIGASAGSCAGVCGEPARIGVEEKSN